MYSTSWRLVEVQDPGDGLVEQVEVVADDEQGAPVGPQEAHQPVLGVAVEVVGRLVEEQHVAAGEQDAGQLDPAALAAGQHPEGQVDAVGAQARARRRAGAPRTRPRSRRRPRRRPRPGRSGRWPARRGAPPWRGAASPDGRRPRPGPGRTGRGPGRCRRRRRAGRRGGPGSGSPAVPGRVTVPAAGGVSPAEHLEQAGLAGAVAAHQARPCRRRAQ